MIMQKRNSELVDVLRADFQHRNEPNFAWKSAVSAGLGLPALRGFWPMSSVDYAAVTQARDVSGGGYHLTNNNIADFGYDDFIPYVDLNGVAQYLSRADGGVGNWADITGTEAYIVPAQQGLTVGGWFYPNSTAANQGMIIKGNNTVNDAYWLYTQPASTVRFAIWNGGAATLISHTNTYTVNNWYFWVGRFDPSTSLDVYQNGVWTSNVAAIPASVQDSASSFNVGSYTGVGTFYDGKASMVFLCAGYLSNAIVFSLFEQTRAMYGV